MEDLTTRPTIEYIPPITPKRSATTYTQITNDPTNGFNDIRMDLSSMHSHVLNSKSSTVFIAASQTERPAITPNTDALGQHVVTIRINTDTDKPKPKISSVHLKSDVDLNQINDLYKKNSLVRINGDDRPKIIENEDILKTDKAPYIYCNSYVNSMTNMVMSSGQCSPSDTLDSGTCSDLDGTPPPLPKKKTTKSSAKKAISVTMISPRNGSQSEVDFEDNDSNISYDSLNSSEFNGSLHADESHGEYRKREKSQTGSVASDRSFDRANKDSFLPQGLLRDIRDRSAKLSTIETESDSSEKNEESSQNTNECVKESKESVLTSFRLVSQVNSEHRNSKEEVPKTPDKPLIITETTYEERNQDKVKDLCYSSHYFDTDKFYDFHLNEKQFDEPVKSVVKSESEISEAEYFAGIKDYKNEAPSTIRSSKGTIRGVKNRVRAGIATFLQIQSTAKENMPQHRRDAVHRFFEYIASDKVSKCNLCGNSLKSYREKDAGKVVLYTTTMGIVRSTYQRCVLVKKILRNLLIKYDERDVFMSTEYQDEIRDRMKSEDILVPQLFVDGQHIGDADTVEKLNENGELRKMLKPYKSPDACTTCQVCGGFRLLPCRICNGSKKSLHRNHFTAEFVALKCMNCDEVGLVRCEACS